MKWLLFLLLIFLSLVIIFFISKNSETLVANQHNTATPTKKDLNNTWMSEIRVQAKAGKRFSAQKGYSTKYCFLINMALPSGKKRFFIYDMEKDSILHAGLVAHGSCRTRFLADANFSNTPECGCSAKGKYKVGYAYKGRFGKAFKLHGLDTTNSNAFKRNIVLHAYSCVPDEETYPQPICNSLGCAMTSHKFLNMAAEYIEKERKPILLWIYN